MQVSKRNIWLRVKQTFGESSHQLLLDSFLLPGSNDLIEMKRTRLAKRFAHTAPPSDRRVGDLSGRQRRRPVLWVDFDSNLSARRSQAHVIARTDVAGFMLDQLASDKYLRQAATIATS